MIAILGVGAVGGSCAAALCDLRSDVTLCLRTPFEALTLSGAGVPARITVTPRVATLPAGLGPADWVLLATKAHQVEGAVGWLEELIGPETRVAVLQNGVEHAERLVNYVPSERVLPVVVDCPAHVEAPGQVVCRRAPVLTVPLSAGGEDFAALFAGTLVSVECVRDFVTPLWHKLCINVTGGAIAALAGVPLPQVRHPELSRIAQGLVRECAAVARAEGAILSEEEIDRIAHHASQATSGGVPSTLADRLAGRPLEADARNGAVPRIGARHGIEARLNQRAAALLAQCHTRQGDLLSDILG